MMFDAIIRGTLGNFGSAILDFYIDYALWINSVLLFYALFLMVAKRGYTRIKEVIKHELIAHYGEGISGKNERNFIKAVERFQFDWQALAKETKSPILSPEKALYFRSKSPAFLKKHFTPEKIYALFREDREQPGS
jgi:hypothetical protein